MKSNEDAMPEWYERLHNKKVMKNRRRALRNDATPAEAELWKYLQRRQLKGRKFRRQHSIGSFVVDFYCPAEKLAVELDGEPHNEPMRQEYDAERKAYLQQQGIRVVRFENQDVFEQVDVVLEAIAWHFQK